MKNIFHFLFGSIVGLFYGLLFAQKSGKKFREELKRSKEPYKKLFNELKSVNLDAFGDAKDWAQNSEELKKVFNLSKKQFDDLVQKANKLGKDAKKTTKEGLEKLAQNAKEAAQKIKKETSKKLE